MNDNPVILFKDVSFKYAVTPVLQNVSFQVEKGELIYIVGPNGGGKTTLMKLILGLLKPDSGKIKVFGEEPGKVSKRIGYTPQHIQFDPNFPVTVMDIVLMGRLGLSGGGSYSKADREAAKKALRDIEIEKLAETPFSRLSGGQRQRTLIARSLAGEPDLLLLDEPTANVDLHTENRLLELIEKLNNNLTIIMVSHDFSFVSNLVKRVICVDKCVRVHPTDDISGDALRQIYEKDMKIIRHDLSCESQGRHQNA